MWRQHPVTLQRAHAARSIKADAVRELIEMAAISSDAPIRALAREIETWERVLVEILK